MTFTLYLVTHQPGKDNSSVIPGLVITTTNSYGPLATRQPHSLFSLQIKQNPTELYPMIFPKLQENYSF